MTTRRAWALVALAGVALGLTPWAASAALVAVGALAALCGLSALAARDGLRAARVDALETALRELKADSAKTAEMWRVYQAGG